MEFVAVPLWILELVWLFEAETTECVDIVLIGTVQPSCLLSAKADQLSRVPVRRCRLRPPLPGLHYELFVVRGVSDNIVVIVVDEDLVIGGTKWAPRSSSIVCIMK